MKYYYRYKTRPSREVIQRDREERERIQQARDRYFSKFQSALKEIIPYLSNLEEIHIGEDLSERRTRSLIDHLQWDISKFEGNTLQFNQNENSDFAMLLHPLYKSVTLYNYSYDAMFQHYSAKELDANFADIIGELIHRNCSTLKKLTLQQIEMKLPSIYSILYTTVNYCTSIEELSLAASSFTFSNEISDIPEITQNLVKNTNFWKQIKKLYLHRKSV